MKIRQYWRWLVVPIVAMVAIGILAPGAVRADPEPLTVQTVSLPNAGVGTAYVQTLVASGGSAPYTWSLSAGALPAGLTLGSTNGVIAGTPTADGTATFGVQAADNAGHLASATLSIQVSAAAPLSINNTSLPHGIVGVAYSQVLTAQGGVAPYIFSLLGGAMPGGLTLAANGTIAGTPTADDTSTLVVQVADSLGHTATSPFALVVDPAFTIGALVPDIARVGVAYSGMLSAQGGTAPYTWSIAAEFLRRQILAAGALPAGLALSTSGAMTGTPTADDTFGFTVSATDAAGRVATSALTLQVLPALPVVTPPGDQTVGVSVVECQGAGWVILWVTDQGQTMCISGVMRSALVHLDIDCKCDTHKVSLNKAEEQAIRGLLGDVHEAHQVVNGTVQQVVDLSGQPITVNISVNIAVDGMTVAPVVVTPTITLTPQAVMITRLQVQGHENVNVQQKVDVKAKTDQQHASFQSSLKAKFSGHGDDGKSGGKSHH